MKATLPRPTFVVFEGLDGSGKSSASAATTALLQAEPMATPSGELRAHRTEILAGFGGCQEAPQLLYLASVFDASERARAFLAAGRSVVLDRYFLSTQAYAAFRGSRLGLDELESRLLPADLTVFLHAPLEVRRQRVAVRGESSFDRETLTESADERLRVEHELRSELGVVGRWLAIDSSRMTPGEIAQRVLGELLAGL